MSEPVIPSCHTTLFGHCETRARSGASSSLCLHGRQIRSRPLTTCAGFSESMCSYFRWSGPPRLSRHPKTRGLLDAFLYAIAVFRMHRQSKSFPLPVHTSARMDTKSSNQSVELTATRFAAAFFMTKTLLLRATLAFGGGSSLLSR